MPPSPKTNNALHLLDVVGERGLTWQELAAATGSHHGSASSMLSTLHKNGRIARLAVRREGSSVYAALQHVAGRAVLEQRVKAHSAPAAIVEVPAPEVDVAALVGALQAVADLQRAADMALMEARHAEAVNLLEVEYRAKDEDARKRYSSRMRTASSQAETDKVKAVAEAEARGREMGESTGWQEGYDQGVKRGQETATGDDAFARGRDVGRAEGEDLIRRRVHAVSTEMHKVITESTPLRAHFKGCYVIHPECTVKALGRSAGITTVRPVRLSQAG